MNKQTSDQFDQYYTKSENSVRCCEILKDMFPDLGDHTFLEPSAGTGSFIDAAKTVFGDVRVKAYDIDPKRKGIKKADFLTVNLRQKHLITIGNPPFGKRSKLAIEFFNKAAANSDIVAFIVPVQFEKYGVQHKLDKDFKLVYSEKLEDSTFIYNDKDCLIRCVFQIWTRLDTDYKDKRILEAPATSHDDFEMFLYNNTKTALKFFDKEKYNWDFAVPRQGFYDYGARITDESDLSSKIQYMFFKSSDPLVLDRLMNIDFDELAKNNTTIPGYGKADVIRVYEEVCKC